MNKEAELNLRGGDIARESYGDAVKNLNEAEHLITKAESIIKAMSGEKNFPTEDIRDIIEDIRDINVKLSDASAELEMAGANGDMTEEIIENGLNEKLDTLLIRVSKLKAEISLIESR